MPTDKIETISEANDLNDESDSKYNVKEQSSNNPKATPEDNQDDGSKTTEETKPEWQDLLGSGSLMKKIIQEGTPNTRPQRLEKCIINYTLSLENDTIVETKENFEMQIGDCEVIQGLDVAIGLMNCQERCLIKIQPRLAYGSIGLPPKIPPNATVVFDVELLSVTPEEEPETLSILERKLRGNKKRERGNWWYCRGENTLAIQCYRRALDYLDEVEGGITQPKENEEITDNALQDLLEDRISVCNNMAAAQLKLEHFDAALNSLQTVLRCQPNNVKALFRKAKVHRSKNDLPAALKCLKKADEVMPNDVDIQKEMATVTKLIQKQKNSERDLARRMFGEQNSQIINKSNNTAKKDSKSFLMWSATIAASFAIGLAGVAAYRLKYA